MYRRLVDNSREDKTFQGNVDLQECYSTALGRCKINNANENTNQLSFHHPKTNNQETLLFYSTQKHFSPVDHMLYNIIIFQTW